MPSGGQNKKSEKQLQIAGTRRPDRHGDPEDAVEFEEGTPHRPECLSDTAIKIWTRAIGELKAAGQLRRAYEPALVGYSVVYAQLIDDPQGFTPQMHTQLRQYITELGFGPVAKTRLGGNGQPPGGKAGDFDGF